MTSTQKSLKLNAHTSYFHRVLSGLPSQAEPHDSNRITIAYFCLSGLDLLGRLGPASSRSEEGVGKAGAGNAVGAGAEAGGKRVKEEERKGWIEWVWALQDSEGGFRGSSSQTTDKDSRGMNPAHLPSTYTAILVLSLLRADLGRLDVKGLRTFLDRCREPDGSYSPLPLEYGGARPSPSFESDARMVYCASVIMDWISIVHPELGWTEKEKEETQGWIRRCQSWEGGFGGRPGLEAQGGTTYCCITANALLTQNQPDTPLYDQPAASRWLTQRQVAQGEGGFQGRPGKDEDVCYSFWCGAGSRVLTGEAMFNTVDNTSALLNAQSPVGGFGKAKGEYPDPFHSYLALAALSMNEHISSLDTDQAAIVRLNLQPLDPVWNVSWETRQYLESALRARSPSQIVECGTDGTLRVR